VKAMILAAGIGSRLRPLTDAHPKALVEVSGMAMIELVIRRLTKAEVDGIIVNAFHLADQLEDFLQSRDFGVPVHISRETELLDTGGGLKRASWFFDDGRPFFLHNADVFTNLDLAGFYRSHMDSGALATLAVSDRTSARHLLFDEQERLCGWESAPDGRTQWATAPVPAATRLAFNGIHVISPGLVAGLCETGAFSINRSYLRLAAQGADIRAFRMDEWYYKDIGSAAKLEEVRCWAREKGLPI